MRRASGLAFLALVGLTGCASQVTASSSTTPREPHAGEERGEGSFRFDRSAVLDAPTATLFLTTPQRRVIAVDAESGEIRWTSSGMMSPLVSQGSLLLAIGEGDKLAVVRVADGGVERLCAPPPGISLFQSDGLGSNSDVKAVDLGSSVLIESSSSSFYAGGMAPTPEMEARAARSSQSSAELDLQTCKPPASPTAKAKAEAVVAVESQWIGGKTVVSISRFEGRTKLPPVVLYETQAASVTLSSSVDRRHVWVSEQQNKPNGLRQRARIFDLRSKAKLGEFDTESYPSAFYLAQSTLVHMPSSGGGDLIAGVSIHDGATRWSHKLYQHAYRGGYPP